MKTEHWTDDQVIAHLYGVGPEDGHLQECAACRVRTAEMQSNRLSLDALRDTDEEVTFEFLARQRRAIYASLGRKRRAFRMRQWASAVAMVAVAASAIIVIEERRQKDDRQISDAQLVEEVSRIAQDSTPTAVAPMEGLFQE
jgi:predicted anti-sigma-YlaC factor YlaD